MTQPVTVESIDPATRKAFLKLKSEIQKKD
jgi:hypothetical protein